MSFLVMDFEIVCAAIDKVPKFAPTKEEKHDDEEGQWKKERGKEKEERRRVWKSRV